MYGLELRVAPDVSWLLSAALMWVSSAVTRSITIPMTVRIVLAGLCFFIGAALIACARVELDRADTTWHPSDPTRTTNLVTSGVFSFSRNPTYLGMWLILVGWAVVLASTLALAITLLFVLYLTRFQIVPEERVLSAMLGDQYRLYASRVRRWL